MWWCLFLVVGSSLGQTQTSTETPHTGSFEYHPRKDFPTIRPVDLTGDVVSILTLQGCAATCLNFSNCSAFAWNLGSSKYCSLYVEVETPADDSNKDLYIRIFPTTEGRTSTPPTQSPLGTTSDGTTQQKRTTLAVVPTASNAHITASTSNNISSQTTTQMYAPIDGSGVNTGAIVGGVFAVVLLVLLIVLAVPLWRRYKKRKRGEAFYDRMQQNVRTDGIPVDAAVRFSMGNRSNGKTEQEILLEEGPADGATVEYATVNKAKKRADPDRQELQSSEDGAGVNDLEDDNPSGYDTVQRTKDPYLYPMTIADFDQSEDHEPDQGQKSPEVTYAQLDLEQKAESSPVVGAEDPDDKTVYTQLRHSRMKYDNLRR